MCRLFGLACLALVVAATLPAQLGSYSTFASGCAGSLPVVRLSPLEPPLVGGRLRVRLDGLPLDVAFMMTGFSNTTSVLGPLPVQLGQLGMPGCQGHVSVELIQLVVGSNQQGTYVLPLAGLPATLAGMRFYQQALVPDGLAGNQAGAVVSDAAEAVLGLLPIPNMVLIPAGTYQRGSMLGFANERPVHTVTITRHFWMGKHEVTQAQYRALTGVSPSAFAGPDRPVEMVSWSNAMSYCQALTAWEQAAGRLPAGYQYRLPTEAEWEYACRAGTTTEWNTGTSLDCGQANFYDNGYCVPPGQTATVGSYPANPWGLHDMHGNVMEWCLDAWDLSANYPAGPVSDPYVSSGSSRVYRGASWGLSAFFCRSAARFGNDPLYRNNGVGFRVVLAPVLVP